MLSILAPWPGTQAPPSTVWAKPSRPPSSATPGTAGVPGTPEFEAYLAELLVKVPKQVDLLMGEITRLVGFGRSQATRFTFLAPTRWGLPEALPAVKLTVTPPGAV